MKPAANITQAYKKSRPWTEKRLRAVMARAVEAAQDLNQQATIAACILPEQPGENEPKDGDK